MIYGIIPVAALTVAYYFLQKADAESTVEAYPKGGAEGNGLITWFYKTEKPSYDQLKWFNLGFYAVCLLPFFVPYVLTGAAALGGLSLAVSIGFPVGSYLSVREWNKWEKS
jgi:deoxyribose-phosphate aldolase